MEFQREVFQVARSREPGATPEKPAADFRSQVFARPGTLCQQRLRALDSAQQDYPWLEY